MHYGIGLQCDVTSLLTVRQPPWRGTQRPPAALYTQRYARRRLVFIVPLFPRAGDASVARVSAAPEAWGPARRHAVLALLSEVGQASRSRGRLAWALERPAIFKCLRIASSFGSSARRDTSETWAVSCLVFSPGGAAFFVFPKPHAVWHGSFWYDLEWKLLPYGHSSLSLCFSVCSLHSSLAMSSLFVHLPIRSLFYVYFYLPLSQLSPTARQNVILMTTRLGPYMTE